MGKTDVVTGGAGFIGSHISRVLLQSGRRVRIIDNFSSGREENVTDLRQRFPDQVDIVRQDIRDLEVLRRLLEGVDSVYHQGARPSVQKSVEDPLETTSSNIEGTLKVLLAARDGGVKKVIFAASSSVYGDTPTLPKHEQMRPSPVSPYAVSKYAGELYCENFSLLYGLPTVGLRYFNVFGPCQDPQSEYAAVIPCFVCRMLAGKRPIIYGDGEQSRDFTFVEDVVSANLLAARAPASGVTVNIGCGERFTLNQLVKELNKMLGTSLEPIYESARPGDPRHTQADIRLAQETIGFEPKVSFQEGLLRTVEWFEKEHAAGDLVG